MNLHSIKLFFLLIVIFEVNFTSLLSQNLAHQTSVPGGPTDITIKTAYPMLKTAKLIGFFADQNYIVDTIPAYTHTIKYKNPKGLNQGLYYLAFSEKDIIQLIMDEDQTFEVSVDFRDFLNTIKISGHEDNKLMYETAKWENTIQPSLTTAFNAMKNATPNSSEYNIAKENKKNLEQKKQSFIDSILTKNPKSLFAKYKSGGQNPMLKESLPENLQVAQYRKEFWNMVDFNDLRLLYTPMIHNKLKRYLGKDLTPQHQDSIISSAHHLFDKVIDHKEYYKFFVNWLLFQYEPGKSTIMDAEAVFVDITRTYVTPERAFWADKEVVKTILKRADEMAQSRLGYAAPNVISTAPDGTTKELLALTADYIVVYMYNPDCEHCQEQSPRLLDFYHKNRGTVDVFAIAIDTDPKKWTEYIAKVGMDWTNVMDPSNRSIYGKYWVDVTPEMYLINKERKIIGKNLKAFQIQTLIDRDKKEKSN